MAAMEPRRRRRRQGLRASLTFGAASALLAGAAAVARPGEVTSARVGATQAGGTAGVFWRGDRGYYCIKIPSLVAVDGVLLALGEGRRGSCKDSAPTDLVAKRGHSTVDALGASCELWPPTPNTRWATLRPLSCHGRAGKARRSRDPALSFYHSARTTRAFG